MRTVIDAGSPQPDRDAGPADALGEEMCRGWPGTSQRRLDRKTASNG